MSALLDNKEEINEQKDRKTDKKKGKKKRLCLSILVLIMLLFVPLSAYASEIKSDGKQLRHWKKKIKP
jgi:flagellar basal body-associated protein FliL